MEATYEGTSYQNRGRKSTWRRERESKTHSKGRESTRVRKGRSEHNKKNAHKIT